LATLQRSYQDVIELFGTRQTEFAPMLAGQGAQALLASDPGIPSDPRFTLYPEWIRRQVRNALPATGPTPVAGQGKMALEAFKAGAKVVVGTDSPNAFQTHGSLKAYVLAGMTPYQALRAATVTPAEALGLPAGTIEPGKLADLAIVEGNPLENIADTLRVRRVVANGRVYELADLLSGRIAGTR
ncbi:MAG: amidohydrolase family protein, partial [Vicinamibacterales bacterium]